jgi:hypothetical protein
MVRVIQIAQKDELVSYLMAGCVAEILAKT